MTKARSMMELHARHGYSHEQLAEMFGCARNTVTRTLSILKLPPEILERAERMDPPPCRDHLIVVAQAGDPECPKRPYLSCWNKGKPASKYEKQDVRRGRLQANSRKRS